MRLPYLQWLMYFYRLCLLVVHREVILCDSMYEGSFPDLIPQNKNIVGLWVVLALFIARVGEVRSSHFYALCIHKYVGKQKPS